MAGIQHLYDIYHKDPKFVEDLLDSTVVAEEKLNGSRFGFEVGEGNVLKFYKRNDSSPITKIDRTLAKYYEKAIYHFESFVDEKISQIPSGWRFGFEYFPNLMPVKIAYDRIPLNHLVLTDITVRDPQGKIIETISDKESLDKWASFLEVESSPIIFDGKLSQKQKSKILSFLNADSEDLERRFNTENFAAFFLKTLDPSLGKSFLQKDLNKEIEAIVFKFDGKNPLKVMNPSVQWKKPDKKSETPSDVYSLTLVLFQEFFQTLDFKKIKLREKTFEERYIEFISKTFSLFCKSNLYKNNFGEAEIDFELPSYLTREEANVNFKFVKDPETMDLLKKSNTNRELFKIMLASMRAHKKKAFGFFKTELIWHHNQIVDKIADYINTGLRESFLAFQEFREVFLVNENDQEWEEYGISKMNEAGFPTYDAVKRPYVAPLKNPFIEVLKNINLASSQTEDTRDVSLVICNTVPYHSGILTALKDARERTGKKSVLCMLGVPFNDLSSFEEISKNFLEENKDLLETVLISKSPVFRDLQNLLNNKKLKVSHVYSKPSHFQDFKIQTATSPEHIDSADNLDTRKPFDYLMNGEISKFKNLCLPVTHNYFHKLKNDLKTN
jgi:hypothetical protein